MLLMGNPVALGDSRESSSELNRVKLGTLELEMPRCAGEPFMQSKTKESVSAHPCCLYPPLSQPDVPGVFCARGGTPER